MKEGVLGRSILRAVSHERADVAGTDRRYDLESGSDAARAIRAWRRIETISFFVMTLAEWTLSHSSIGPALRRMHS
jgi:hypothetical protein